MIGPLFKEFPLHSLRRQPSRQFALWLALAAVLLRALLPQGFMLERAAGEPRIGLAICYASPLARLRADHGTPGGTQAHADCAFAAASGPALPSAVSLSGGVAGRQPFASGWVAVLNPGTALRVQPPARAPPLFS
jgi:hypothetical protein